MLARGHDPRDYSQYLIETASDIGHAGGVRLAGVFMSGHQVSKRIRRILNEGRAPALSRTRGAAVVAMCVLACVATMGVTPIRASSQASIGSRLIIRPVQPRIAAPESPYPMSLEWLEGDEWAFEVQPIASSEELAAYGRLANIRERDAFIERFWAQRDPSPGTPVNEFRDEYQRRIAFGRRSFDTSSGLGFDTDRGRMYLMFGAPDSIETMDLRFDRFEMWRYTSIAGLGGDVRIRFSLSRDGYCGLRLVSPAPVQTRRTVGLSPLGLTAIAIPVDARTSTGVQYELRTRSGETIDQGAIGFIDTAGEPLIDHLPEEWFADGFGCTHALPTGSYTVATAVRRLDGEILRETVAFDVE